MVVSFPLWPREMLDETAEIRRGAAGKKENKTLPPPSYIYILSFFFLLSHLSALFLSVYIYIPDRIESEKENKEHKREMIKAEENVNPK